MQLKMHVLYCLILCVGFRTVGWLGSAVFELFLWSGAVSFQYCSHSVEIFLRLCYIPIQILSGISENWRCCLDNAVLKETLCCTRCPH